MEYLASANWVWQALTVCAALFQVARNASQRTLSERISSVGATYVRFLFGLPVALVWLAILLPFLAEPIANPGRFMGWCLVGGITQILGNACLLMAMRERSFMLSVAYSKTEAVQAALIGIVVLGEALRLGVSVALVIATTGVMLITLGRRDVKTPGIMTALRSRGALFGILCGALFGLSATTYRAAALSTEADPFVGAGYTLFAVLAIQTLLMTFYLLATDRSVFPAVLRTAKLAAFSGVMGGLASLCWFTAMALHNIADVRALGLVEMLFSYLASRRIYRDRIGGAELLGSIFIGGSALALIYIN